MVLWYTSHNYIDQNSYSHEMALIAHTNLMRWATVLPKSYLTVCATFDLTLERRQN